MKNLTIEYLIMVIRGLVKLIDQHIPDDEDLSSCKCIEWVNVARDILKENNS